VHELVHTQDRSSGDRTCFTVEAQILYRDYGSDWGTAYSTKAMPNLAATYQEGIAGAGHDDCRYRSKGQLFAWFSRTTSCWLERPCSASGRGPAGALADLDGRPRLRLRTGPRSRDEQGPFSHQQDSFRENSSGTGCRMRYRQQIMTASRDSLLVGRRHDFGKGGLGW